MDDTTKTNEKYLKHIEANKEKIKYKKEYSPTQEIREIK
jgi:hypothetical protein